MKEFSKIDYAFENFIKIQDEIKLKQSTLAFPEYELSGTKQVKRIKESLRDFWKFDKHYFTHDLYDDYSEPNKMCKDIISYHNIPGYFYIIGARKHGKTVTAKKLMVWLLISGRITYAGVYCQNLLKASNMLLDICELISTNQRLNHDFNIEFSQANADQISFKVYPTIDKIQIVKTQRRCSAYSEKRSVRGSSQLFIRPQFLLCDDIETLTSSFTKEAVDLRQMKIVEAFDSLSENATIMILGNDIHTSSLIHRIRLLYDDNLLPDNVLVKVYKAWDHNKPLWPGRYKATSEHELKKIIKPLSEADWQQNYQQNPVPVDGFYFTREHYLEYSYLPKDIRAVLYVDPNLSKKGRGDTTAITVLGYSPKYDNYYIVDVACKSYSDSDLLLNTVLELKYKYSFIYALAFDGNVTQESTWTNNIRNWCRIHGMPFPVIDYKHYRVNDLAKNTQIVYNESKLKFPANFSKSESGLEYLQQLFAFTGEKKSGQDDAPDSLICAFEFLHERNLARKHVQQVESFNDFYSL